MTTPLFLLRCVEIGISIADLDLLTIGLVLDIWTEKANDDVKYKKRRPRRRTSINSDYHPRGFWGIFTPIFRERRNLSGEQDQRNHSRDRRRYHGFG